MGRFVEAFEQEQSVLGAILLAPDDLHEVTALLVPNDFEQEQHRKLYEKILELDNDGVRADKAALIERLDDEKFRELVLHLDLFVPLNSAKYYAGQVLERSRWRQVRDVSMQLVALCREWTGSADELLNQTEQRIMAIRTERGAQGFKPIGEIALRVVKRIDEMRSAPGTISGLPTGLRDFDVLTGGFQPGQLIILAARPKMGKTAVALQIANHVAEHSGGVGVFSLEMTEEELGPRILANMTRVNGMKFRNAHALSEFEIDDIVNAQGQLHGRPLFIDDTLHTTIGEIRSKARRLAARLAREGRELKLIILDYLQLAGEYGENREQAIAEISRGLKALAKELRIPVMSLSQLNRALEKRPDKRPIPSDLRDSGSLEQDADMVVFLYRDEIYHPNIFANKGKAEMIVSLCRNGAPGTVELEFKEQYMRFVNIDHQEQLAMPEREEPPHPAEVAR